MQTMQLNGVHCRGEVGGWVARIGEKLLNTRYVLRDGSALDNSYRVCVCVFITAVPITKLFVWGV